MNRKIYNEYVTILESELVPALGCTEPIALAYAAAKAKEVLGKMPDHITMRCSGNIIKNVKGVKVPNSGGMKGVEAAAVLGITGGDPSQALEDAVPVRISTLRYIINMLFPFNVQGFHPDNQIFNFNPIGPDVLHRTGSHLSGDQ